MWVGLIWHAPSLFFFFFSFSCINYTFPFIQYFTYKSYYCGVIIPRFNFDSAPLLSVPLFGGSAAIEWITLSSSGVYVSDSQGKTPRILQGNDNTIPRWVKKTSFNLCILVNNLKKATKCLSLWNMFQQKLLSSSVN